MVKLDTYTSFVLLAGSAALVAAVLPYTFFCMMLPKIPESEESDEPVESSC